MFCSFYTFLGWEIVYYLCVLYDIVIIELTEKRVNYIEILTLSNMSPKNADDVLSLRMHTS